MELVEQLKHVYSYNEIYELLYDGPVSFDDIKAHLMLNCHKTESTARSYITAIRGGNPGMIIVDEEAETMELNKEEILDLEENLQLLFDWNLYDKRFYEIKGLETDLNNAKYEIRNLQYELDKQKRESEEKMKDLEERLSYYRGKRLSGFCEKRIMNLDTVSIGTDCMKDLGNDMDSPIKRLQRCWNPFRRIKREYRIRRMFAQEMVSGHWFITTEIEGKDYKCMLVPIDEFKDLYERLKNCLENYESTHHLNKTGGWWNNY